MDNLQAQINALTDKVAQMGASSNITRDQETALRERLGLTDTSQAFPVGAIFMSTVATNPASLLGYGTWSAFGTGQMPVSYKSGDSDFGTLGGTGGEKTHTLSVAEMPAHAHPGTYSGAIWNTNGANSDNLFAATSTAVNVTPGLVSQGGGSAHNNLPPFIVVQMWQRTA